MGFIIVVIMSVLSGSGIAIQKLWQKSTLGIKHAYEIYSLLMSICALAVFCIMAGFRLSANLTTLVYSFAYGLAALLTTISAFCAMKKMSIILYSVFSRGSTLFIWLFGVAVFREKINIQSIISAVLFGVSILMPLLGNKDEKKTGAVKYIIGIGVMLLGTAASIIVKLYSASPDKMPEAVLCFYTNVFVFLFLAVKFILTPERREYIADVRRAGRKILLVPLGTTFGNLATLLSMYAIGIMPLSQYSVLSASMSSGVTFLISKAVYREDSSPSEIAAFLLSTAAVLVNVL